MGSNLPPFISYLEGVPQPYFGDLLTKVINHVSKSWDDPPSVDENIQIQARY